MVTYCVRRCLMFARNVLLAGTSSGPRRLSSHAQVQSTCMNPEITGAFHLNRRGVVRIAGRDTVDLLQGLITSDVTEMNNVGHGVRAQYSMMLNVQGRVLYDLILYNNSKIADDVCFLVECDSSLKDDFIKAVKRYRIRKKVDISDVSDEYTVWAITSDRDPTEPVTDQGQDGMDEEAAGKVGAVDIPNAICCVPDPRVPLFGQRVLFHSGDETLVSKGGDGEQYDSLRYRWGIPEGPVDLPPGNCLPLESNLTIMNGVSFLKGCYIGQELTARTHHTGVIRKRLLPIVLDSQPPSIEHDAPIVTDKGKAAGKLRGAVGKRGLGLMRLEHHDKALSVCAKDGQAVTLSSYRPGWWPEELRQ